MKIDKAIILVAGEGKRLKPLTDTTPKCLVPVNGIPILENALRALLKVGVRHVVLVVGALAHVVRAQIGNHFEGLSIDYVENPDYAKTNSMFSLHLGLAGVSTGAWILEGDGMFDADILNLSSKSDICWFADSMKPEMTGSFLTCNRDSFVAGLEIIRVPNAQPPPGMTLCKSVGVLRLTPAGVAKMKDWLKVGVQEAKTNLYYDLIVREHIGTWPIEIIDVAGSKWFEIDDLNDLKCAEAIFR